MKTRAIRKRISFVLPKFVSQFGFSNFPGSEMSFYCPVHICNPFYYYSKKTRIYFWSYSIFSPRKKKFHRFKPNYFSKLIILMFKDLIKKKRANVTRRTRKSALFFRNIIFFPSNIIMYLANLSLMSPIKTQVFRMNLPKFSFIHILRIYVTQLALKSLSICLHSQNMIDHLSRFIPSTQVFIRDNSELYNLDSNVIS